MELQTAAFDEITLMPRALALHSSILGTSLTLEFDVYESIFLKVFRDPIEALKYFIEWRTLLECEAPSQRGAKYQSFYLLVSSSLYPLSFTFHEYLHTSSNSVIACGTQVSYFVSQKRMA